MNVIFRVDASLTMGTGHVLRCLTLACVLKKNGSNVGFICRKHVGNLVEKIRASGFCVYELEPSDGTEIDNNLAHSNFLGVTQKQDLNDSIEILKKVKPDWIVVDHYGLGDQWQKSIRDYCKKIMVIDDLADRNFYCDVLLNQNLGSHRSDYTNKVPKDCELLLGCEYALLRPEFLKLRGQALERRERTSSIENILVSVGGIDIKNITLDILHEIDNKINITVVLGEFSPHNEYIKNYAAGKNIKVIIDAENMAELMLEADLAIGACGSTSWERCCLGLPSLLFITGNNQKKIATNLENLGAIIIVDNLKENLNNILNDVPAWKIMSKICRNICDGNGANRIKL